MGMYFKSYIACLTLKCTNAKKHSISWYSVESKNFIEKNNVMVFKVILEIFPECGLTG